MATVRFSRRAETDLAEIAAYTLQTWGERQLDRYLDDLKAWCHRLAAHPNLGRRCEDIRPGLRRSEYVRRVIFYRKEKDGILISRVLHQRMLPKKGFLDDEDTP